MLQPQSNLAKKPQLAVAVFLATAVFAMLLSASCGHSSSKPPLIGLAALVQGPNEWSGKQIEVQGTLRRLTDPDGTPYGVIETTSGDRVGLKQIDPWQSLVDQTVDATGTLRFDPNFGWYLDSPTIKPLPSSVLTTPGPNLRSS